MKKIFLISITCIMIFGCKGNSRTTVNGFAKTSAQSNAKSSEERKNSVQNEANTKPYEATWMQIAYIKGHFVIFKYPIREDEKHFTIDKIKVHKGSIIFTLWTENPFVEKIHNIKYLSNRIYSLNGYKFQWFDKAKHIAKWTTEGGDYLYVDSAYNSFPIVKYTNEDDTYIPENLGDKDYQYNKKAHYVYKSVLKYNGINILEKYCVNRSDGAGEAKKRNLLYIITTHKDTVELKKPAMEYDAKGKHYKYNMTYCPTTIRIKKGKKGNLICISGEPEGSEASYEGLYDINGNLLAFEYYQITSVNSANFIMSKGDMDKEYKKYGITDKEGIIDDKNTPNAEICNW